MRTALVIAQASLAEHKRRRLVLFFFVISVLLTTPIVYVVRSRQFQQFAGGSGEPAALMSTGALQILALIATLAVSMGSIGRTFANGEALTIMARPVARWQYALGRLLGSATAVAAFCLVLGVETAVVQLFAESRDTAPLLAHWATIAFNMLVLAGIGTLVSALASNAMIAGVTAFFTYESILAISRVHSIIASTDPTPIRVPAARWFEIAWLVTPKLLAPPGTSGVLRTTPGLVLWGTAWLIILAGASMLLTSRKEL